MPTKVRFSYSPHTNAPKTSVSMKTFFKYDIDIQLSEELILRVLRSELKKSVSVPFAFSSSKQEIRARQSIKKHTFEVKSDIRGNQREIRKKKMI